MIMTIIIIIILHIIHIDDFIEHTDNLIIQDIIESLIEDTDLIGPFIADKELENHIITGQLEKLAQKGIITGKIEENIENLI